MIERKNPSIEIKVIKEWVKTISNRILIKMFFGIPFIIIKINKDLVNIIWDLKEYQYINKKAFIETLLLNVFKNLTPEYNKLV